MGLYDLAQLPLLRLHVCACTFAVNSTFHVNESNPEEMEQKWMLKESIHDIHNLSKQLASALEMNSPFAYSRQLINATVAELDNGYGKGIELLQ